MKKSPVLRAALAAGAAIVLAAGGYALYRLGAQNATRALAASKAAPSAEKKPLYWHDPMVPGQKFDQPGKSPFMDMQLVPVYAEAEADSSATGGVAINARMQQNLGVRTADVRQGALVSSVNAVGSLAYNERDVAVLQARSNGYVEKLYVRASLDAVRKGQALADLYVPDWVAAQEEYLAVQRMQGNAPDGLVEAAKQRMRLAGMDDAQVALVVSSGKLHPRLTLVAPISGVLSEISLREGMTLSAGLPLFRINGLSTIWVNAEIPESNLAQVRLGSLVEARTASLPGQVFKGKVSAILPEVNAVTRTLKARIELANPAGRLVPGMFASLHIFAPDRGSNSGSDSAQVLLVPSEAVIQTGSRSVVMLAQAEGRFMPVEIEVGAEANGQTEVRKGLQAGQKVVVSGQFLIDSEASLKAGTTRMLGAPAGQKSAEMP